MGRPSCASRALGKFFWAKLINSILRSIIVRQVHCQHSYFEISHPPPKVYFTSLFHLFPELFL